MMPGGRAGLQQHVLVIAPPREGGPVILQVAKLIGPRKRFSTAFDRIELVQAPAINRPLWPLPPPCQPLQSPVAWPAKEYRPPLPRCQAAHLLRGARFPSAMREPWEGTAHSGPQPGG